jgi:hypothetical protein
MKNLLFFIASIALLSGCDGKKQLPDVDSEKPENVNAVRNVDDPALDVITQAVESLTIGANSFVLETYLWRDFMPVSEPDGSPMIAINWLVDVNSNAIPDNIDLMKQYVFYEDMVWEVGYTDEVPPSVFDHKIEKISRGGPKWGPRIHVDVVAEVRDSSTGQSHYIMCPNALVERTD